VSNKFRIYIRNSIGEIGLPCGIPVFIGVKSSIWPSKESRSVCLFRKEETYEMSEAGSRSSCRTDKS